MRTYLEFGIKKFQNKLAYRVEVFMGTINTILTIVIFCSIYRALYGGRAEIEGISFSMVATNFVIAQGLSEAFSFDEMYIQARVSNGMITNELLKPVSFKCRMLAENIGEGAFKVLFNFVPAVIFSTFYTKLCPPASVGHLLWMIVSVVIGYLILWGISFVIQTWCFWLFSTWGIMIIKNFFINVLSGAMLPIWFMPDALKKVIAYTPFASIYFTPVKIYLGQIGTNEIIQSLMIQVLWAVIFFIIGSLFWNHGTKKLVVQGG